MGISPLEFLARELKRQRIARGLTQEALGARIHVSDTQVSAIETGAKPPRPEYLKAIDEVFNTGGLFVSMWKELVKDGEGLTWLGEWIEIEQQATAFRWYEVAWVPGLLQTEAYARAVFAADDRLSVDEVEERTAGRMERQKILFGEKAPHIVAVLDEKLLERPIGGGDVMREQLHHLATMAERRRTRIHVVPAAVGAYAGLDGPFIIASMPDGDEVAYLDNRLRGQVVEQRSDVAEVQQHWEAILAQVLTPQQSVDRLMKGAKSWMI